MKRINERVAREVGPHGTGHSFLYLKILLATRNRNTDLPTRARCMNKPEELFFYTTWVVCTVCIVKSKTITLLEPPDCVKCKLWCRLTAIQKSYRGVLSCWYCWCLPRDYSRRLGQIRITQFIRDVAKNIASWEYLLTIRRTWSGTRICQLTSWSRASVCQPTIGRYKYIVKLIPNRVYIIWCPDILFAT